MSDQAVSGESIESPSAPPRNFAYETTTHLELEQIIDGRYRVLSLLGKGGMGSVYRVQTVPDKHEFALKTLNPGSVTETTWRRFQKEAKAAELLDHPALIKVHDFGLIDDKQPFFVMDLFEGENLAALIKEHGPLTFDRTIDVFFPVCQGLGYSHQKGVIHRDIKPSNIMVANLDNPPLLTVKIVDFGIAKMRTTEDDESMTLTRTGEVFGTPFYMSPEQCLGQALDHRADIYSLGCVMFESLTGLPPFMGESALSTMMKHQS
ncbi:MAG: serine/threonine protein kinase, partial [Terriglobales bacterium]